MKELFTVKEAAEFLRCHEESVRRAIKAGDLKAAMLGRTYRISRQDLNEYYQLKGGGSLFAQEKTGENTMNRKTLKDVLALIKDVVPNNPEDYGKDKWQCRWIARDIRIGGSYCAETNMYENGCINIAFSFDDSGDEFRIEFEPDSKVESWEDCLRETKTFLDAYANDAVSTWELKR